MKKLIRNIIITILFMFPVSVFAEGYINVSPSSLTIEEGSTKAFTITAYNVIGDATISSNNTGVATVNTSFWETGMVGEKETKSGTVTVTGVSVGNATIVLTLDAETFDEDSLSGQTRTVSITVVAKPTPQPTPTPDPTPQPTPTPTPNPEPAPANNTNNLSTNTNIKNLKVDGYELVKVDDNNYKLSVGNNTTSISITGEAEDSKSKVSGLGKHDLNVGENKIEVVVTSESGSERKITIVVTRKDAYKLDDLKLALDEEEEDNVQVLINKDNKISKKELEEIVKSKKKVNFNYYDENKQLLYSWSVDGKKVSDSNIEFLTTVTFDEKNNNVYELSNYADGKYITFKHSGNLPKGTKIKLYVGDKFKDGSLVNIYHYSEEENSLDLVQKPLAVKSGYVEFEIEHCSSYFATMSNIEVIDNKKQENSNLFIIISIVEFIIIIVLLALYLRKNKSKGNNIYREKKEKEEVKVETEKEDQQNNLSNISQTANTSNNESFFDRFNLYSEEKNHDDTNNVKPL